ncbi:MAG TPA: ABC transporter ATP-binding protein [Streptosporangiaceae bacterium]|nr:ABC transporter ATP-binding protein [Streptosporangiaceae bacterium]
MNVFEASGLSKRYRGTWALRDCDLAVPAGHVVALIGPNGAGKTTLLRLLAGLTRPTAGSLALLGGGRPGSDAIRNDVAYLDQQVPFYRDLRVRDMLRVAGAMNRQWDEGLAQQRLAAWGIPLRRRAGKLSGGQQALLALTLAIARRPRLLLLDEPMASLDPLARQDATGVLMTSVAEDGLSVVISSHVLTELERVASYLIVLSGGQVQVAAPVDSLLAGHRALIGPAGDADRLAGAVPVIAMSRAGRQAQALARTTTAPSGWAERPVTMEELVLGYLREPAARAVSIAEVAS